MRVRIVLDAYEDRAWELCLRIVLDACEDRLCEDCACCCFWRWPQCCACFLVSRGVCVFVCVCVCVRVYVCAMHVTHCHSSIRVGLSACVRAPRLQT